MSLPAVAFVQDDIEYSYWIEAFTGGYRVAGQIGSGEPFEVASGVDQSLLTCAALARITIGFAVGGVPVELVSDDGVLFVGE